MVRGPGASMSVAAAARELDVSPRRVRQLIDAGELEAFKLGRSWAVSEASVARRRRQSPPAGRPLDTERVWAIALIADEMVNRLARRVRESGLPRVELERRQHLLVELDVALREACNIDVDEVAEDPNVQRHAEATLRRALEVMRGVGRDRHERSAPYDVESIFVRAAGSPDELSRTQAGWLEGFGADRQRAARQAGELLRKVLTHGDAVRPSDLASLRSRSEGVLGYYAHPSVVTELVHDERVVASGAHGAAAYGADLVPGDRADAYLEADLLESVIDAFALQPVSLSEANVWLRPVPGLPIRGTPAPRLLVAADLIERGEPRWRAAARVVLQALLLAIEWQESA